MDSFSLCTGNKCVGLRLRRGKFDGVGSGFALAGD
jgi:hypothetical protein